MRNSEPAPAKTLRTPKSKPRAPWLVTFRFHERILCIRSIRLPSGPQETRMRLSSMFFALLLSPLTLAAQTSSGNGPHVVVIPPSAQACPVQLAVDRVATGAVI